MQRARVRALRLALLGLLHLRVQLLGGGRAPRSGAVTEGRQRAGAVLLGLPSEQGAGRTWMSAACFLILSATGPLDI